MDEGLESLNLNPGSASLISSISPSLQESNAYTWNTDVISARRSKSPKSRNRSPHDQGSSHHNRRATHSGSQLTVHTRGSTLHQETGRILRHRVSEETRNAVRDSTLQLEAELKSHNMRLRKKFEKRFLEKIHNMERHRQEGVDYWTKKTANSPYHVNLFDADYQLNNKIQSVRKEFKRMETNYSIMESMRGKPKYEVVSADVLKKVSSPTSRLALERRIVQGDLNTVNQERSKLDQMVYDEFLELERKFPAIRDRLSASRESLFDGSSQLSSLRGSVSRSQSRKGKSPKSSSRRDENNIQDRYGSNNNADVNIGSGRSHQSSDSDFRYQQLGFGGGGGDAGDDMDNFRGDDDFIGDSLAQPSMILGSKSGGSNKTR